MEDRMNQTESLESIANTLFDYRTTFIDSEGRIDAEIARLALSIFTSRVDVSSPVDDWAYLAERAVASASVAVCVLHKELPGLYPRAGGGIQWPLKDLVERLSREYADREGSDE